VKYYVYLSETKIQMLHAQIAQGTSRTREASIGFDIKVLKGQVKESRALPESAIPKLVEVINELQRSELVGRIEEPKQYIAGTLRMKWNTYGSELFNNAPESPIIFWSYCESQNHPHEGTVMALAGSKHNLIGQQGDGSTGSSSMTDVMTRWFLQNIDDPFDDEHAVLKRVESGISGNRRSLGDFDVANGAYLATTSGSGVTSNFEFLAKVLHTSDWPQGFRSSRVRRVILGSPLFVAYADTAG
jgi:hypothetical protein